MLAIHDNRPKTLAMLDAITFYIEHRREVVVRRTRYLLCLLYTSPVPRTRQTATWTATTPTSSAATRASAGRTRSSLSLIHI